MRAKGFTGLLIILLGSVLLTISCSSEVDPSTANSPSAAPTVPPSSPTTPAPEFTSTPDIFQAIFDALQDEGINVEHQVGNADGGWGLIVGGVEVPNAHFDENGQAFHIQIGDELMNIPASEVPDRLRTTEDGVLVFMDAGGNAIAGFGPNITAEKLAGRWFVESEVIGTAENPVVIGNTWQSYIDWIGAEKIFYDPFPEDVYYPESDKIWRDYATNEGYEDAEANGGFSGYSPFGLLPRAELWRSPFRHGVNYKILEPNEEDGRTSYTLIEAEQVLDPADRLHIQELNYVNLSEVYKTLEEAIRAAKRHSYYSGEGFYMLPAYYHMHRDFLEKYPRLENNFLFLEEFGYLTPDGEVDQARLEAMVMDMLETGHISPEMERLWWLSAYKTINEERVDG